MSTKITAAAVIRFLVSKGFRRMPPTDFATYDFRAQQTGDSVAIHLEINSPTPVFEGMKRGVQGALGERYEFEFIDYRTIRVTAKKAEDTR